MFKPVSGEIISRGCSPKRRYPFNGEFYFSLKWTNLRSGFEFICVFFIYFIYIYECKIFLTGLF